MATHQVLRPKAVYRAAAIVTSLAATSYFSSAVVLAEAAPSRRKPIYDDPPPPPPTEARLPSASTTSSPSAGTRTPVEPRPEYRLATEIRKARLSLYDASRAAEDGVNSLAARFFALEHSFTQTVVSLAPPINAPERQNSAYLPNLSAVLVAALGGSIVSHRRNILLRTATPLALGIGAGWYFVPVTMRNVGDLVWSWEKRAPALAEAHLRVRDGTLRAWDMTKLHGQSSVQWMNQQVTQARKGIEGWISSGR